MLVGKELDSVVAVIVVDDNVATADVDDEVAAVVAVVAVNVSTVVLVLPEFRFS